MQGRTHIRAIGLVFVPFEGGSSPFVVTIQNKFNLDLRMENIFRLIHSKYTSAWRTHDDLSTVDNTELKTSH